MRRKNKMGVGFLGSILICVGTLFSIVYECAPASEKPEIIEEKDEREAE